MLRFLYLSHTRAVLCQQVVAGVTVAATHLGVGCAFGVSGVMLPNRTHPAPGDDLFKDPFYAALFGRGHPHFHPLTVSA